MRTNLPRLLLFGFVPGGLLAAQVNTGTVLGTITDQTGAVIAEARVTALNELTGFSRSAVSDAEGSFLIPLLPVSDNYRITVESGGFKSSVRSGVILQVGQNLRADFQLELGNGLRAAAGSDPPAVDGEFDLASPDALHLRRAVNAGQKRRLQLARKFSARQRLECGRRRLQCESRKHGRVGGETRRRAGQALQHYL